MRATIVLWSGKIAQRFLALREFRHIVFSMLFCLAGCATSPLDMGKGIAAAEAAGFVARNFDAGGFQLFALQRSGQIGRASCRERVWRYV